VSAKAGEGLRVAIGVLPTVAAAVMPRAIKRAKERGRTRRCYRPTVTAYSVLISLGVLFVQR
jgi:hypothetical protein